MGTACVKTGTVCRIGRSGKGSSGAETIKAVTDRGYFKGEELKACEEADIETYLPKPKPSGNRKIAKHSTARSIIEMEAVFTYPGSHLDHTANLNERRHSKRDT